jgi:hypothetical protein
MGTAAKRDCLDRVTDGPIEAILQTSAQNRFPEPIRTPVSAGSENLVRVTAAGVHAKQSLVRWSFSLIGIASA